MELIEKTYLVNLSTVIVECLHHVSLAFLVTFSVKEIGFTSQESEKAVEDFRHSVLTLLSNGKQGRIRACFEASHREILKFKLKIQTKLIIKIHEKIAKLKMWAWENPIFSLRSNPYLEEIHIHVRFDLQLQYKESSDTSWSDKYLPKYAKVLAMLKTVNPNIRLSIHDKETGFDKIEVRISLNINATYF